MGCPILLGYAEKAVEISNSWDMLVVTDGDDPTDDVRAMARQAMRVSDPFRPLLERRATFALRTIITDLLKRAITNSEMNNDVQWLGAIPADLEPVATRAVLNRIKDRAIAWNVNHSLEQGKEKTVGELSMVFTERVWEIVNVADNLMHDMGQGSYTTAGTALAFAMAAVKAEAPEWLLVFDRLKEIT